MDIHDQLEEIFGWMGFQLGTCSITQEYPTQPINTMSSLTPVSIQSGPPITALSATLFGDANLELLQVAGVSGYTTKFDGNKVITDITIYDLDRFIDEVYTVRKALIDEAIDRLLAKK